MKIRLTQPSFAKLELGLSLAINFPRWGAAATYVEEQLPHMWRSSRHICGGAAATYVDYVEIRLTQSSS